MIKQFSNFYIKLLIEYLKKELFDMLYCKIQLAISYVKNHFLTYDISSYICNIACQKVPFLKYAIYPNYK